MAMNPRVSNGNLRRKHRARFKAMAAPCGICRGALGPIRYDEPSDAKHPLSFVIDEIRPISRWKQFGYGSPEEAARDWNNLQPAHYCCNSAKSNKIFAQRKTEDAGDRPTGARDRPKGTGDRPTGTSSHSLNIIDGEW